jgi:hypothetical protein
MAVHSQVKADALEPGQGRWTAPTERWRQRRSQRLLTEWKGVREWWVVRGAEGAERRLRRSQRHEQRRGREQPPRQKWWRG